MRPPAFWSAAGWRSHLLLPAAAVTGWVTARRVARPGWQASVPVLCCGNAGVGGAGKTTLALDLLWRLQQRGGRPHALLRGYGGRERGPLLVRPGLHGARRVGDEALLLAEVAPTWVSADRAAGAWAAAAEGADAIVMDDGLQNPGLAKDCSLLVIDGGYGFGNGRLLPAGPLREPVAAAAARCWGAVLVPDLRGLDFGRDYLAFAGIGRPEKFFAGLRAAGVTLARTHAFADHHPYTPAELAALTRDANRAGAKLLTTPKDMARLAPGQRAGIAGAGVSLAWEDEAALNALLDALPGQAAP
jgi:tetraacyldisaccharide 4'-kinase